jgi:putative ABC transport system permease protein
MDAIVQDVRYAFRRLRKSPAFTAIAVLTLALGIGANTAIFSVVNAVLLRPLPFRDPGQLVFLREAAAKTDNGFSGLATSVPNLEDYRQQQHAFDVLSIWTAQSVNLTGQEKPDRVVGSFVSSNFFQLFEVTAQLGRSFTPHDERPGAEREVVLSYGTWKTRFGGDANILGRQLTLNGEPFTVIGVLPSTFIFPLSDMDVWLPIQYYPNYKYDRANKSQLAIGRIHSGTSRAEATEQLNVIAQRLARDYPQANAGIHMELVGLQELQVQNIRPALLILLGAVGLILLIASSNIANLLLARGVGRSREVAVRIALGASRRDLIQQLLAEALLLSLAGGTCGLLLAKWGIEVLLKLSPVNLPLIESPSLDAQVLGFTAMVSLFTGVLFGLLPALQSSNPDLRNALGTGGRTAGESAGSNRLRGAFVIAQMAISVVLLVGAGLLIRTFYNLLHVDPGFNSQNLLTAEYRMPRNKYATIQAQWNFHRQVIVNASQIPGVVSAAIVLGLPFSGNFAEYSFTLPEMGPVERGQEPRTIANYASREYFSTIGIPLLNGRGFDESDTHDSPRVAVISRTFAQRYWPNQDPIGKRVHLADDNFDATVIGIVGDVKQLSTRDEDRPYIYFPIPQNDRQIFGTLVLRTAVPPETLRENLRQAIWKVDPDQPVWKIRTVEYLINRDLSPDKFVMTLMIAFAGLALLLTAIGTYGVISYSVTQRTQEIGVRMALGATSSDVLKLVVRRGIALAIVGAVIGAVGAFAGGRFLQRLLYGVRASDPLTFLCVLIVLITIAFLACYLPARRAASVDPMIALRYE